MPSEKQRRQAAVKRRLGNRTAGSATRSFAAAYGTRLTSEPTSTVSVRFPDSLLERVAAFGNTNSLSASETVRLLVTEALNAHDQGEANG